MSSSTLSTRQQPPTFHPHSLFVENSNDHGGRRRGTASSSRNYPVLSSEDKVNLQEDPFVQNFL
ncbi:hypothetical protein E2C01_031051 [Portunus trituberculatus]|uniref:Uncharacterized protein n=1 Tax=Portunus trituberculatus TaxID=210409 RepID=A0A5B7EVU9_PORTR|nr:hypothetical protein [Portunus trituberculatus]